MSMPILTGRLNMRPHLFPPAVAGAVTVLALMVLWAGCDRERPALPTDITHPRAGSPRFTISDGARDGYRHFFFLPPLVGTPTVTGTF
jgi:hypothetical protein